MSLLEDKEFLEAKAHSQTLRLMYRLKYNMPANDPRYLDTNDLEILEDFAIYNIYLKNISKKTNDVYEEINLKNSDKFEDVDLSTQYSEDEVDDWFNEENNLEKYNEN